MNTPVREGETIEGSRTTRNRPYPVLKCSRVTANLEMCTLGWHVDGAADGGATDGAASGGADGEELEREPSGAEELSRRCRKL